MAHPPTFDPDDPLLARLRGIALALPDAQEKISHGTPAFFTTKVFAYYGGHERTTPEWVHHPRSVLVLVSEDERAALLAERAYHPAYLGPYGWVGVDVPAADAAGWDEVAELLDSSYRLTAGARRVARLASVEGPRPPR